MAHNTQLKFTINRIPTEIIVRFAPDLRPCTVSALRLVSRLFRDIFTADRYYRSYLIYYPDRKELYYKDLENIGNVDDRWRRCLEAEKGRLKNWRKGKTTRVDNVDIPLPLRTRLQALIDDKGEYWMLFETAEPFRIVLMNFTNQPMVIVHDVSCYNISGIVPFDYSNLAPGQIVINERNASHVFNYFKRGNSLSIEHHSKIEDIYEKKERFVVSGQSNTVNRQRNLLVACERYTSDGVFRVWDMQTTTELESVSLRDFSPFTQFFEQGTWCYIHIVPGSFPNIIVLMRYELGLNRTYTTAIFNLETRQMTYFFGPIEVRENHLELGCIFFNDIYAGFLNEDNCTCGSFRCFKNCTFKLLALQTTSDFVQEQQVVFQMSDQVRILEPRLIGNEVLIQFHFKEDRICRWGHVDQQNIKREDEVYALRIDDSQVEQRKIKIPDCIKRHKSKADCMIIGPFSVFTTKFDVHNHRKRICKTFDKDGKELFNWRKTKVQNEFNPAYNGHSSYFSLHTYLPRDVEHVQNLSKCILQHERKYLILNF